MKYYVDQKASAPGDGSREHPFARIQQAAEIALPGDEVLVAPGVYREAVHPRHAGTLEARITYRAAVPGQAVITGSEPLAAWEQVEGSVYRARVDNAIFTDRNPYTTLVRGDWFIASFIAHTGEVFLDGKALYEVTSPEALRHPAPSRASWYPQDSLYVWYTEQDGGDTVLWANFQDKDPREHEIEFTARSNCFWPEETGIGYITLSGFKIMRAATQWAPPTAYQEGMVGPHWSKGWIIEDCEICDSKCSGISLGKYRQAGNDNKWLHWKYKDGTQTERECILQAQREGWSRETVGSHTVRRCHIHDCGQTGIVGHLGGVFSLIEDNHIHDINVRQNLAGAEIGGIKMHAAIDVIYRRNHIHHCTRGLWLDWQAQGTRVTRNLFHDNTLPYDHLMNPEAAVGCGEDIFIEVSHGPTLVDHNILLSDRAMKLPTQGVAVAHNLIAGAFTAVGRGVNNGSKSKMSPRYTPYHVPHGTAAAGFMTILHGDMRFYNNIFVQKEIRPFLKELAQLRGNGEWDDFNTEAGTAPYAEYPTREAWEKLFEGYCGMGSAPSDRYYLPLPVYGGGNVYANGARGCPWERDAVHLTAPVTLALREEADGWRLETDLYALLPDVPTKPVSTASLGIAFEPEQPFENPDGTPIRLDRDYYDRPRGAHPTPGPFETPDSISGPVYKD